MPMTRMSDASPPPKPLAATAKGPKKKKKGGTTVRFASTKAATKAGGAGPSQSLPRRRKAERSIDLEVQGTTHRLGETASEAVWERMTPEDGPPMDGGLVRTEADRDAWVVEQQALTNSLLVAYGKAGRQSNMTHRGGKVKKAQKSSRGDYVPKPRNTQRAKQRRQVDAAGLRARQIHGLS